MKNGNCCLEVSQLLHGIHIYVKKTYIALVKLMNKLIHFHCSEYVKKNTIFRDSFHRRNLLDFLILLFPTLRDCQCGHCSFLNKLKTLY